MKLFTLCRGNINSYRQDNYLGNESANGRSHPHEKTSLVSSHVDTEPRDELFAAATTLRTRARAPLRNNCGKKLQKARNKHSFRNT